MERTTVDVLGTTYTVEIGTKEELGLPKDLIGMCDVYNKVISVFLGELEENEPEGVAEIRAKEVIQHELAHAYIKECGMYIDGEQEEMICTFLEANLRKMTNSALDVMEDFDLEWFDK